MPVCCVVGCQNSSVKAPKGVSFHRFPARNEEQRELWIKALKRQTVDGSNWKPGSSDRICSDHFYDKKVSNIRNSPSYVPSIFPTRHVKEKGRQDANRFERFMRRRSQKIHTGKNIWISSIRHSVYLFTLEPISYGESLEQSEQVLALEIPETPNLGTSSGSFSNVACQASIPESPKSEGLNIQFQE